MDSSFYLVSGAIALVFGLLLAFVAWTFFRRFQKMNGLSNRAHEMTGKAPYQRGSKCPPPEPFFPLDQ